MSTYTGFPDTLKADPGSLLTSKNWNSLSWEFGASIEIAPVESSSSVGARERYYDPLRRVFHKVLAEHPANSFDLVLALATKAINDEMGLVSSLLVYSAVPRISSGSISLPEQEARINMMHTVRHEIENTTAQLRLHTTVK